MRGTILVKIGGKSIKMSKQKEEFFKPEKCIKCTNSKCKHPIELNVCFRANMILNDVACPKYECKTK